MWELLEHVLLHAVIDSLKLLPFLFLAYLLIEYIEHRASDRFQRFLNGSGKFGPLGGAVVGLIPQCGFSGAAANLYSCRVITVGTLAAVFLATSDEAIPVLLANPEHIGDVGALLLCKVVIAVLAGFLLDFAKMCIRDSLLGQGRKPGPFRRSPPGGRREKRHSVHHTGCLLYTSRCV